MTIKSLNAFNMFLMNWKVSFYLANVNEKILQFCSQNTLLILFTDCFIPLEINVDEIEQLASSKGNVEAAYGLLMKDIKPFATILGLDESKLSNYRQQSSSFQSTQGTIGLVGDVTQKKGKI